MAPLVCATFGITLAIAACSSSSSGTGGNGTGGSQSGSGTNRALTGSCSSSSGSSTSSCTQAEEDSYVSCLTTKCDTQYQKCLGSGYKSGSFGGLCGAYINCTNACACGDSACQQKCAQQMTSECQSCFLNDLAACTEQCPKPACMSSSSGGNDGGTTTTGDSGTSSGKTCADLQACCARITDASKKSQCDSTYNQIKSSDVACNAAYSAFAASCP